MNRLDYNRKLLLKLNQFIEANPDSRFIQALWNLEFIDVVHDGIIADRFYEESEMTFNRIEKGMPKGEHTKMNSIVPCNNSSINELFICQCHNTEHQLIFSYFNDTEDREVYVSVHLVPHTIWGRIKNAFKYIFGHRSKYGDFDEFIFKREDADRLQSVVDYLKS